MNQRDFLDSAVAGEYGNVDKRLRKCRLMAIMSVAMIAERHLCMVVNE